MKRSNKIIKKTIKIVLISVFLVLYINIYSFAAIDTNINIHGTNVKEFTEPGNYILGMLQGISIIASVIALSIIGIKYMLGSIEEKAEYKKTLPYYLLGAILSFGIVTLVKYAYIAVNNML